MKSFYLTDMSVGSTLALDYPNLVVTDSLHNYMKLSGSSMSTGVVSGLAALIYVARVGQAKADAGTGYELLAITAVVLGGASIFGGSGTVHGTLLGVAILAVLKIGLTLSDQPSELVGILTGALLLAVLTGDVVLKKVSARRAMGSSVTVESA